MQDPYEILGLSPGAAAAEVKRAFRRLAMAWHPDRNGAADAEERFKRINAAYELILDPERYAAWRAENGGDAAESEPAGDATEAPAGEVIDVELSLEEAAFGCRHSVDLDDESTCPTCTGSGRQQHAHSVACADCKGVGRLRSGHSATVRCPACHGRGYVRSSRCGDCDGRGTTKTTRHIEVTIPPALRDGDRVRLAGQGRHGGDLFLHIRLRPHPLFELHGRDLHCTVPVGVFTLMLGGELEVPTLRGTRRVELAPGSGDEPACRIAGLGFPGKHRRGAGDLHLRFEPVFPAHLDDADRECLDRLQRAMHAQPERRAPRLAEWAAMLDARRRSTVS